MESNGYLSPHQMTQMQMQMQQQTPVKSRTGGRKPRGTGKSKKRDTSSSSSSEKKGWMREKGKHLITILGLSLIIFGCLFGLDFATLQKLDLVSIGEARGESGSTLHTWVEGEKVRKWSEDFAPVSVEAIEKTITSQNPSSTSCLPPQDVSMIQMLYGKSDGGLDASKCDQWTKGEIKSCGKRCDDQYSVLAYTDWVSKNCWLSCLSYCACDGSLGKVDMKQNSLYK